MAANISASAEQPSRTQFAHLRLFVAFTSFYFLAHSPLLLVQGPFWDDWIWVDLGSPDVAAFLSQIERPLAIWALRACHFVAGHTLPVFDAAPLAAFVSHYLTWLVLWRCNAEGRFMSSDQAFWVVVMSALAPLNFSRVVASTQLYQIALLVFAIAALCQIASVTRRSLVLRTLSWPLLAMACQVESFYFAVLLLYIPVLMADRPIEPKRLSALRRALRHCELIAIPVASYLLRMTFFAPHGVFETYNAVTLAGLVKAIPGSLISAAYAVYGSLAGVAIGMQANLGGSLTLVVSLMSLTAAIAWGLRLPALRNFPISAWPGVAAAFVALAFLLFPYAVTQGGGVRPLSNWGDRHLLTAPLALGLVLCGCVAVMVRAEAQRIALAVMAGLMLIGTALGYLGLVQDTHLMAGVVAKLRHNETARNGHSFVYVPNESPLWQGRELRPYEWTGMLARAYGENTRLALPLSKDVSAVSTFAKAKLTGRYLNYAFDILHPDRSILKIELVQQDVMTIGQLLRLSVLRATNDPRYDTEAGSLVRLIVSPFVDDQS